MKGSEVQKVTEKVLHLLCSWKSLGMFFGFIYGILFVIGGMVNSGGSSGHQEGSDP